MTAQSVLFVASIVFFALAALFAALAAIWFFRWNIPDIRADLSGKKRVAAIAKFQSASADARERANRGKKLHDGNGETDKQLATDHIEGAGAEADAHASVELIPQSPSGNAARRAVQEAGDGSDPTTVFPSDQTATAVLESTEEPTEIFADAQNPTQNPTHIEEAEQPVRASAEEAAVREPAIASESVACGDFDIVRKIVLTQSTEFVHAGKGEGNG